MMKAAMVGWKEVVVLGSKGAVLAAKMRGSKSRMKNWIGINRVKQSVVLKAEERLNCLDEEDRQDGWSDDFRREMLSLIADIWGGLRKEEQA